MARTSYTIDGARAGQARTALSMTQADMADALGVNRVTMNKVENGRANVSLEFLERLSELTGRSREWLLGEPEQVDAIELGREQLAAAFAKISAGFETLNDLVATLNDRAREAAPSLEKVGS